MSMPTPHLDKLRALLNNTKLPRTDLSAVELAIRRYDQWISNMGQVTSTDKDCLSELVELLTAYKNLIDLELIYDSKNDFLYRQKGQLKLDNSIIEEFLPWLVKALMSPQLPRDISVGPTKCYAAITFESSLNKKHPGAGIRVKTKDQDFALSKKLYIQASNFKNFEKASILETSIAYVATEIKTNLDKTMFQEASATAHDLRVAVPKSRYFLMCEWLDMTPMNTASTDIERVLLLRGAKRLSADMRKNLSTSQGRKENRDAFCEYLEANPFRRDVFARWIEHMTDFLSDENPNEEDVLDQGFF